MSSLPNLQVLPQLLPGHVALYSLTSAPWMEAEKLEETQMLAPGIPSLLQGRGWGPERGRTGLESHSEAGTELGPEPRCPDTCSGADDASSFSPRRGVIFA